MDEFTRLLFGLPVERCAQCQGIIFAEGLTHDGITHIRVHSTGANIHWCWLCQRCVDAERERTWAALRVREGDEDCDRG